MGLLFVAALCALDGTSVSTIITFATGALEASLASFAFNLLLRLSGYNPPLKRHNCEGAHRVPKTKIEAAFESAWKFPEKR
jgi:hypothetical protein